MTPLGETVRKLREGMGLTQAQLAERSHLGKMFIWAVESDREVMCDSWQIQSLAQALGVSEGSLLCLIPKEQRWTRWPGNTE